MQLMRHGDRPGRTVTVFGDNEIRLAAARVVPLEGVGSVQQDHHVGVLLDSTGFTEVGEHGLLVGALLRAAV